MRDFLLFVEKRDRFAVGLFKQFSIEETSTRVLIITPNLEYKRWVLEYIKNRLKDYGKEIRVSTREERAQEDSGLLPRFSFENFVVGPSNEIAYKVCLEVAKNPGSFSPLFLYGGVGLGKSHLLHSIGNLAKSLGYGAVYLSANDFSERLIKSLKSGQVEEFRSRYSQLDILLLDDVQFLSGKERTQVELFRVFEYMQAGDRQLVFVSDRHPKDIADLSERLISRFSSGLVIEMGLDEETKTSIIRHKLLEHGLPQDEEHIRYVCENTGYNVREIEGLIRTLRFTGFKKKPTNEEGKEQIILKLVARSFNLKPEDLRKETKERRVINARQVAMYMCKKLLGMSYAEIGRLFGRADHTAALYSIRRVEERRNSDRRYALMLETFEKNIRKHLP
ncbi:MAG: chromosomal replication initiator protein DnaA [Acidobacteria bacterium]|jgi:chromosomal replication initiator protein|nr:MAG: chromosomal replication initiator protein DnaA [Acidobacteriota bacterium]